MKTKQVFGLKIQPPKKSAFTIETPENLPKLHMLLLASGRRGGGKSVAVSNLVRMYLEQGILDRVMLISPTYWSNKEIFEPLDIDEDDIIEPTKDAVKTVVDKVEADKAEWEDFQVRLKKWKDFQKLMKSDKPLWSINPELLLEFMEMGFLDNAERPVWKYAQERLPRIFLIIDDSMGTDLMNPKSGLTNLCIKHRHIAEGTGISIAMLVQSYSAQQGIARPIRENCTFLCLFKNNSEQQIKKIYEEVGDKLTEEQFAKMFEYATNEPYSFLSIDFAPKKPEYKFRKRFDEYLEPSAPQLPP